MNGTNEIGGGLVGSNPGPSWKAIGTGDFNDDGHSDILWQNTSSGQVSIWEMNGTNVIGGGVVEPQSGPKLEGDRNGRFQRRRPFRHSVAEHEQRPGRDLGNERDQCDRQATGEHQSRAEFARYWNGRFQRRRFFRHPIPESERSGDDLGNERDQCDRRRGRWRQSGAELACGRCLRKRGALNCQRER